MNMDHRCRPPRLCITHDPKLQDGLAPAELSMPAVVGCADIRMVLCLQARVVICDELGRKGTSFLQDIVRPSHCSHHAWKSNSCQCKQKCVADLIRLQSFIQGFADL